MGMRLGTVSEIDAENARLRVKFEEDEIVSDWLPVAVPTGAKTSFFVVPDVGEQCVCLMDERSENGVFMGTIYSQNTKPKNASADATAVEFSDGTKIIYDRSNSTFTIDAKGDISLKTNAAIKLDCNSLTFSPSGACEVNASNVRFSGDLTVQGNVNVTQTVQAADCKAGTVSLLTHIHPETNGANTLPPTP